MEKTHLPTLQDIEESTTVCPRLYAEEFSPILRWDGGDKLKDGSCSMHYPVYSKVVEEFFEAVRVAWIDYQYDSEQA